MSLPLASRFLTAQAVFAGSTPGLVPTSAGGTTNYLRADGTWAAPAGGGGGGGGTSSITFTNTDRLLGRVSAGGGAGEEITCTAAARSILDDASVAAIATTLGLGTGSVVTHERQLITQTTANQTGLAISGYSLTGTSTAPAIDITGTWNTTGHAPLIRANITNTASGGSSKFIDLQISGTTQAYVKYNGEIYAQLSVIAGGSTAVIGGSTYGLWTTKNVSINSDFNFERDAAGSGGLRNGTSAQKLSVYNTWSSSTSYERLTFDWQTTANTARMMTEKGSGGGTARALALGTDGTDRLSIAATGSITFNGAYTFPTSDGTANYYLKTNGAGALSWAAASGGLADGDYGDVVVSGSGTTILLDSAATPTLKALTLATGSLTGSSTPALNVTQTWNNAATTFIGSLWNITDTASNAASKFFDMQVGGVSKFSATKAGALSAASYAVSGSGGVYHIGGGTISLGSSSSGAVQVTTSGDVNIQSSGNSASQSIAFINANSATSASIRKFVDNVIGVVNATSAQRWEVYNTYTSSTSYERGVFDWQGSANTLRVGTQKGSGGGAARALALITDDTTRVTVSSTGQVTFAGDNVIIATSKTPSSASDTGTTGAVCWDSGFVYVCTATNTWKRAAIATW